MYKHIYWDTSVSQVCVKGFEWSPYSGWENEYLAYSNCVLLSGIRNLVLVGLYTLSLYRLPLFWKLINLIERDCFEKEFSRPFDSCKKIDNRMISRNVIKGTKVSGIRFLVHRYLGFFDRLSNLRNLSKFIREDCFEKEFSRPFDPYQNIDDLKISRKVIRVETLNCPE